MYDIRPSVLERAGQLQAIWEGYVNSTASALEARRQAQSILMEIAPDRYYALSGWDLKVKGSKLFGSLVELLKDFMQDQMARNGYRPNIEADDEPMYGEPQSYREFADAYTGPSHLSLEAYAFVEVAHARTRSIVQVAQAWLDYYSPDRAREAALAQAAGAANDYFNPSWRGATQIKSRGPWKVISMPFDTGYSDPWEMAFGARAVIYKALDSMQVLLAEAGMPGAIAITHPMRGVLRDGRYASRQSIPCGTGLTLIFFKGRLEFQFAPAVLDALQIAIAQHSARPAAAA